MLLASSTMEEIPVSTQRDSDANREYVLDTACDRWIRQEKAEIGGHGREIDRRHGRTSDRQEEENKEEETPSDLTQL